MAAAFGVHFGATNSCLAVFKDGKVNVVANDAGDRVTPSVVAFTDHEQTVGLSAKQGLIRNAANTVCHVKLLIGRRTDDPLVQTVKKLGSVKLTEKAGCPHYEVDYKEKKTIFSTFDVATLIYKKVREIADNHGDTGDSHNAVLTVPMYFTDQQKQIVKTAAEKGGFSVFRIMLEPCAAALAYDLGQNDHHADSTVMIYRVGGMSIDATVLNVSNGLYHVIATKHCTNLGGQKFTELLVNYYLTEFKRQSRNDCSENKRSVAKLRSASESVKHVLSTLPTAHCSVESLFDGMDFQCNTSRSRFDGLIGSVISSYLDPLTEVLREAGLKKSDIDKVILCGGSTKIPHLQKHLRDYFGNAEMLSSISPDEIIAIGASKQAALLTDIEAGEQKENSNQTELPCMATDVLVKISAEEGVEQEVVLKRDTPIPIRKQQTYQMRPDQTDFCLQVGFTDAEGSFQVLAKVVMEGLTAGCLINSVFHAHSDGSLHVSCTEPTSSKTQSVVIETS